MPLINKSAELRNNYGEGDLAVMSIETYETLSGKNELYQLIQEGIDDIKNGKTLTEEEIIKNMDNALGKCIN
ncbi:hypothetical protein FACS1894137_03260 [Spirochaetia bacterium]|nr:hypothetical protein FACS1894137_03260 [Spirochaetia bacterium]